MGKSEIALFLAKRLGGEIISVDSMQVYCGLDIGTAKPSAAERAQVRHHLIDVVDLKVPFDAAKFCELANQAVREIQSRGHVPILCGGTGLYFKAFLEGLGEAPPASETLRRKLELTPLPVLLAELADRDPATYARIDRQNPRRVIRAVEVIRLTGKPFSVQRAAWSSSLHPRPSIQFFGFSRPRADLHARISARVDDMFHRGLVAETQRLLEQGLEQNRTAMQALGYRQVVEHLRGVRALAETIDLVKARTRQFARRQMTWFRAQSHVRWFELNAAEAPDETVSRLMRL